MRLQFFGGRNRLPSLRVNHAKILEHRIRIHAAIAQHPFHFREIVADKSQVKHQNTLTKEEKVCIWLPYLTVPSRGSPDGPITRWPDGPAPNAGSGGRR